MYTKKYIEEVEDRGFLCEEDLAIELFEKYSKIQLKKYGIKINSTGTKYKTFLPGDSGNKGIQGEYSLIVHNEKEAIIFDVKKSFTKSEIKDFTDKELPKFKLLFPYFNKCTIYGGIGSLFMTKNEIKQAEKAGLFVFTQGE